MSKDPYAEYRVDACAWCGTMARSGESFIDTGAGKACTAFCAERLERRARCGHKGCELRPGHIPGHTDR